MKCGEQIKARRLCAGMTREVLSEKSGVSIMTIRRYENLEREPRVDTLERLAAALGCTVLDLMSDKEGAEMSIGENIKEMRKRQGLTQTELAAMIGKTSSSIKKYELDLTNIPMKVLDQIAAALGVTRLALLEGVETNEGYEIIAAEVYRTNDTGRVDRIVLGRNVTKYGTMYVTWESATYPLDDRQIEYFWGHYHDDEAKARADYHRRLFEKYER